MMSPRAGNEHQQIVAELTAILVEVIDRKPWMLRLFQLTDGKLLETGRSTIENGTVLESQVVTLGFRLLPGQPRPQIEVTHTGGQRWII